MIRIMRSKRKNKTVITGRKVQHSLELWNNVQGWLFLLPALIAFALFKYYPIFQGLFVSLFRFSVAKPPGEFIGLQNYIRLFKDAELKTAKHTGIYRHIIYLRILGTYSISHSC